MTKSPLKLLFIRLDKIGDLVCTLPCDEHPWLLAENASTCPVTPSTSNSTASLGPVEKFWIIQKGNEFILENSLPPRKYLVLDKSKPKESQQKLSDFLKENHFDAAFSFQSPWWVNWTLFKAKIPQRFGVLSQWHSFLFLNQGLRQKRSRAEKHEADYNFEIVDQGINHLHKLVNKLPPQKSDEEETLTLKTPILKMQAPDNDALLAKWHLTTDNYFVVHPGMAGSALNWQPSQYIEFIESYLKQFPKKTIVITGTPQDEAYLIDIKVHFANHNRVIVLQNQINTRELLTVLKNSSGLLAPSTGVLHLAASLGVPCYGIYSPIKVQHPQRWAARGERVFIFLPSFLEVAPSSPAVTNSSHSTSTAESNRKNCPANFKCLKDNCPKYDCMKEVLPSTILSSISNK